MRRIDAVLPRLDSNKIASNVSQRIRSTARLSGRKNIWYMHRTTWTGFEVDRNRHG